MEGYESMILSLAALYKEPLTFEDAMGNKVKNETINDALIWAALRLGDKTEKQLECFANCIKDGFEKTSSKTFPLRPDFNRAYDLCFRGLDKEREETRDMLSKIKIEYKDGPPEDVKPEPYTLLAYLKKEHALKHHPRRCDILYKTFGMAGMKHASYWQGEYLREQLIPVPEAIKVDWLQVYKERPPKEENNEQL